MPSGKLANYFLDVNVYIPYTKTVMVIIGGAIAVTANKIIENRSCMSKCSNKSANTDKEINDADEHPID